MLAPLGSALLVVAALGCTRGPRPAGAGDAAPLPSGALRLNGRWPLEVGSMSGFSSLGRDAGGLLWSVPEKGRVLVRLRVDGEQPGQEGPALFIEGVPHAWEIEAIAWLDNGRVALATETQENDREQDTILIARQEGDRFRVEERIVMPYRLWGVRAPGNRGIEGLCAVGGLVVAAAESVTIEGGRRFAPLGIYDLRAQTWRALRVRLTSQTGKLSAIACRSSGSRTEAIAMERHFEVARLLRFEIPAFGREVVPTVIADLGRMVPDLPNMEGLAWTDEGVVVLTDNNYGGVRGPTEVFLLGE